MLLDALYWVRQVLALLLGGLWGFFQLQGAVALGGFVAAFGAAVGGRRRVTPHSGSRCCCRYVLISTILSYSYATSFLRLDEERIGGMGDLLKEGAVPAVGVFLVPRVPVPQPRGVGGRAHGVLRRLHGFSCTPAWAPERQPA